MTTSCEYLPPGKICLASHEDSTLHEAIEKARDRGDRWLFWAGPGKYPSLYDVHKAKPLLKTIGGSYVPDLIPKNPKVVFVTAAPSELEAARRALMVGPVGVTFEKSYLEKAGLTRSDVAVLSIVPMVLLDDVGEWREPYLQEAQEWMPRIEKQLQEIGCEIVIALGRAAAELMDGIATEKLPHPQVLRKYSSTGEVERKMDRVKKNLTSNSNFATHDREQGEAESKIAKALEARKPRIVKEADAQGLVSGVVLEPDSVDAQGDVVSIQAIEKALVGYMVRKGRIGYRHSRPTDAQIVEIFQAPQDLTWHRSPVKEGSLCATVKVNDPSDKSEAMQGFLNAFSIGGIGKRTPFKA
jgi:uracil-DNA glycosylase family 4